MTKGKLSKLYLTLKLAWRCLMAYYLMAPEGHLPIQWWPSSALRSVWVKFVGWRHMHNLPLLITHDDIIKWKHFLRYWPFVWGIHWSPVNSPQKGQWHGTLMFSLVCAWINGWVNNPEAGDLRCYVVNYDVTVMCILRLSDVCMQ